MRASATALAVAAALCAGTAAAQTATGSASTGSNVPMVSSTAPSYSDPMKRLMDAADHFRESVHAMAQLKPNESRNDAIQAANKALADTQDAMVALPPQLRSSTANEDEKQVAVNRLQDAADDLRKAVQEAVQMPAGPRRNQAVREADRALLHAQQALAEVPRDTTAAR